MEGRALVVTVGTGTRVDSDIVSPLKKSIEQSQARRVVLLASVVSDQYARRIVAELGLDEKEAAIAILEDIDSANAVFERSLEVLRDLRGRGFEPAQIDVDYTSGTKPMSAGLALAATAFGCATMKYIGGPRDKGVVIAGREEIKSIGTDIVRAHHELEIARRLFSRLQFDSVLGVLPDSQAGLLDADAQSELAQLRALAQAYSAWDKFDHATFVETHPKTEVASANLAPFVLARTRWNRLSQMAADRKNGRFSQDLLADLFNNATRRMHEGRHDDAVARLYRFVEMLAQHRLNRAPRSIDTSDVKRKALPETLPEDVERWFDIAENGDKRAKVAIGLQQAYRLLHVLDDDLATRYWDRTKQRRDELLSRRNNSILAHGVNSVSGVDATALRDDARELALSVIEDFDERCRALQFPWIAAEGSEG
ncbi:MAG: TIGR02710 family CRISPR-associated CARF protein [Chloroflexota bacterium]